MLPNRGHAYTKEKNPCTNAQIYNNIYSYQRNSNNVFLSRKYFFYFLSISLIFMIYIKRCIKTKITLKTCQIHLQTHHLNSNKIGQKGRPFFEKIYQRGQPYKKGMSLLYYKGCNKWEKNYLLQKNHL